jgi:ABC-type glutathione transport system ATPase component
VSGKQQELVTEAQHRIIQGNGFPVIRVDNLHKTYEMGDNKVHALRGISLEIRRGEFVAIMGASG